MKILFLYTELAGYVMSCFKALAATTQTVTPSHPNPQTANRKPSHRKPSHRKPTYRHTGIEVHVVRWPVNREAPFEFDIPPGVTIYDRPDYTDDKLLELVQGIDPDKIIISGWIDRGYLKVAKHYFGQVPTILTLDNQWNGGIKQQVARLISPFYLKKHFSHAWVPGEPQAVYARKLGFGAHIQTGFYSADTASFSGIYQKKEALTTVPQRLLYVGRYIPQKGLDLLFAAFMEIQEETPSPWELWCLGAGEQYDQRPSHPMIKHHGFVQPSDMPQYLMETGVFVLPSRFEPWGVVVHEMAAAGFPMVCSSAIGATSTFLHEGENGFLFKNENKEALKAALKKVMNMDQDTLKKMSLRSHELGMKHTPNIWAEMVMGIRR